MSSEGAAAAERERDSLLFAVLILLACAMEAVLIVFERRVSLARFPAVIQTPEPIASILGVTEQAMTWFIVVFGLLILCQVIAFGVALRIRSPRYGLWAIGIAAVLIASMIPVYPGGAHDVYHNIVDARTLWVYGQNPITTPPAAHANDPFVAQLFDWQDLTSSYGPVWYIIAGAPLPFTGDGLVANVVGQKVLVSLFLLGTLLLVYDILRRWRPRSSTAAIVLLGWSPLLLWEIPGNAHNDIVMMFFAVAALWAVQRGSWRWAFPLLALAVATKFIMLLLVPLLLVWLLVPREALTLRSLWDRPGQAGEQVRALAGTVWRSRQPPLKEVLIWLAAGGALLLAIYLPFFAIGSAITLANHGALQDRTIASPTSLTIAFLIQYVSLSRGFDIARALAIACFSLGYLVVLWRCRGSFEALVSAAMWAVFLTLVFPTWWFWPWYLAWLMPFGALLAGRRSAVATLVFSSTALLFYVTYYWRDVLGLGLNWYANQVVIAGAIFAPLVLYLLGAYAIPLLSYDHTERESLEAEPAA